MELHPLAKFYNTPENFKILRNFVDSHNMDIEVNIDDKQLEREVKKAEDRIDKALRKVFN
jgi:hypothetical protein